MKTRLYVDYEIGSTDITGEDIPAMYGWHIYKTDGVEVWDVDGPFNTEKEAKERITEIESDLA